MTCNLLIFITLLTLFPITIADEVLEYDESENEARIVGIGKTTVNHSVPLILYVYNITQCVGNLEMCYKSTDTTNGNEETSRDCKPGYCKFLINIEDKSSPIAASLAIDEKFEFKFNQSAPLACPMEFDEVYTYHILEKPRRCKVVFAGVKKPKEEEAVTEKDKLETAYVTLWIVVGVVVGVFLLAGALILIYCFVIAPVIERRRQKRIRRRDPATPKDDGSPPAAPLIIPKSAQVASSSGAQPQTEPTKPEKKKETPVKKGSDELSKPGSNDGKTASAEPPKKALAEPKKRPSVDGGTESAEPPKKTGKTDDKPSAEASTLDPKTPKFEPPPKDDTDDLLLRLIPLVESPLDSLHRLKRIKPETYNTISPVWDADVQHDLTKLEKMILRCPPNIAMDSVEQLTAELDHGLLANGAAYGTNKLVPQCWEYANFRGIAASASYRLFIMTYASEFADVKPTLEDPLVEKLSIPGLYMFLMNDSFDRTFREKLILELRSRAQIVLKELPPEELAHSSFPMSFLAKLYGERPNQFVEGTMSKTEKGSKRKKK
uniref:Uncharacterized protein n=1 Tax=Panagrellus redivivus TaxID=6233 RepID=A0A7E4V6E3_PANRE